MVETRQIPEDGKTEGFLVEVDCMPRPKPALPHIWVIYERKGMLFTIYELICGSVTRSHVEHKRRYLKTRVFSRNIIKTPDGQPSFMHREPIHRIPLFNELSFATVHQNP